ncbi:MAG: L-threonylcarbamoyladenylate synthase [Clostridia bacterium]|nr:L-threonylcarbamoyladenylate synthase [Clostridia bacterium]
MSDIQESRISTQRMSVDPCMPAPVLEARLADAADIIRRGGLVAFPTETVYGLGANALDGRAVARIFVAKGRPQDNPLIVHIAEIEAVHSVAESVPASAWALAREFWPGPLTMVLPRGKLVPEQVSAGLATVAVRMPSHPAAAALIRASGLPIAAPSANISGRPSPTSADHVWADLAGRVEMLVDAGPAGIGVESTVIDMTVWPPLILRPGGATVEAIRRVIPETDVLPSTGIEATGPVKSPGLRYKHYAPRADLWLYLGDWKTQVDAVARRAAIENSAGRRVGLLITSETALALGAVGVRAVVAEVGSRADLSSVASALFDGMRRLDQADVDIILAESYSRAGLGLAIMNRLERAAGGKIVR